MLSARANEISDNAAKNWRIFHCCAVTLVFLVAIWQRFALPLTPITDPDTWGYLTSAVHKLNGLGFTHHFRNYFYPGFLYLVLRCFGDFRAITIAQHLLGLVAGIFLLVSWRRVWFYTSAPRRSPRAHTIAGLILAACYLWAPTPIAFETDLRPEGIAAFLLSANILCLVEFCYRVFVVRTRSAPLVFGILGVVSSIAVSLAKPSIALPAIGALVIVASSLFCSYPLRQKIILAVSLIITALLLLTPAYLQTRHEPANNAFLPTQLFVIHADIIRDEISREARSSLATDYPRDLLEEVASLLAQEIPKGKNNFWPALGFDADYLMYHRGSVMDRLRERFSARKNELREFLWYSYRAAWLRCPGQMIRKIARQMLVFYSPRCPAYGARHERLLSDEYRNSLRSINDANLEPVFHSFPPFAKFVEQTKMLAGTETVVRLRKIFLRSYSLFQITFLWEMIAAVVAVLLVYWREDLMQLRPLASLVVFLGWYNFASCLEVAVIHSLDNPRYNTIQLVFTLLAQFVAALFLLDVARVLFQRGEKAS